MFTLLWCSTSGLDATTVTVAANNPKKDKQNKREYLVFVAGDIKDVIAKESQENKSFANASLGITRLSSSLNLALMIKVADNKEPTKSDYGFDICNIGGKNKLGGKLDCTFLIKKGPLKKCFNGVRLYGEVASNEWIITDDNNQPLSKQVTLTAFGAGIQKILFEDNDPNDNSKFASLIFIGVTGRLISGDIGFKENDTLRETILGTSRKLFLGLEIFLELKVNDIRGFIDITSFSNQIKSFGKTRFTVGIAFEAPLIRKKF
jgi:hypothetical protein